MNITYLDRLRQPEYTGENRCIPCTITNVAIAAVASTAVAVASPPLGVGLFGASLATIYLRGYLVPGTPELTKRYFPDWLLRKFDKDPRARIDLDAIDAESVLREAGAIVDDEATGDVVVAADFETAWYERMARMDGGETDRDELAALLDVEADRIAISWHGDAFVAYLDSEWVGQWESRAAFVADIAASEVLSTRYDDWEYLPMAYRSQILGGLRLCIERCPACEGHVDIDQHVVSSCCRSYDVVAATCNDCNARLFEVEFDSSTLADDEEESAEATV